MRSKSPRVCERQRSKTKVERESSKEIELPDLRRHCRRRINRDGSKITFLSSATSAALSSICRVRLKTIYDSARYPHVVRGQSRVYYTSLAEKYIIVLTISSLLGAATKPQRSLLVSHLQNMGLRQELDRLKNENMLLRDKLSKYTDV